MFSNVTKIKVKTYKTDPSKQIRNSNNYEKNMLRRNNIGVSNICRRNSKTTLCFKYYILLNTKPKKETLTTRSINKSTTTPPQKSGTLNTTKLSSTKQSF